MSAIRSDAGHTVSLLRAEVGRRLGCRWDGLPFGKRTPGDMVTGDPGRQATVPFRCCASKMGLFKAVGGQSRSRLALLSKLPHTHTQA